MLIIHRSWRDENDLQSVSSHEEDFREEKILCGRALQGYSDFEIVQEGTKLLEHKSGQYVASVFL